MDVVDLRTFYAQHLGVVARRFIGNGIRARWTDTRAENRREVVMALDGRFVLGVALTSARVRLLSGREMIFDGMVASGMTYV